MNRTSDGRFKQRRCVITSGNLEEVIDNIKSNKSWTWTEFAEEFGVSAYTLRQDWRKNADSIPFSVASRLNEMSGLQLEFENKALWHGQKKGGQKSSMRGNTPSEWDKRFAELYGALLGDGCVYSNMNGFCITGNASLDEDYIRSLAEHCRTVFDIDPKIHFQEEENVVRLILNSRKIARFLEDEGFPCGAKKDSEFCPPEVLVSDKELLSACIRGLFDTDGGIYAHPNSGIMLDITAKNDDIFRFLAESSETLDLPLNPTEGKLQLYGESKVDEFLRKVGSSNSRNIKRYLYYKENESLPSADSTTLLRSRSQDFNVPYFGFVV
jgi:hypothetical protein